MIRLGVHQVPKLCGGWMSILGTRVIRTEDPRLLTEGGTYTDDLRVPALRQSQPRRVRVRKTGSRRGAGRVALAYLEWPELGLGGAGAASPARPARPAGFPWPSTHSGSGPSSGSPVKNLLAMQPP